jgi:hypothetical protein
MLNRTVSGAIIAVATTLIVFQSPQISKNENIPDVSMQQGNRVAINRFH